MTEKWGEIRGKWNLVRARGRNVDGAIPTYLKGSFSFDDGNGSENVTFKMNSRFFKFFRVYFKLLKMSNVDECPRVGFLGTLLKFRKRKKNLQSRVYVLHKR